MEILLVNHSLYTGGVETLIVRMANWLVRNEHSCSILLRDTFEGDLTPLLDSRVRIVTVGNWWDWLAAPLVGQVVWNTWDLPKPEIVYTFEKNWSIVGLLIRGLFIRKPPAVATGAYHLNQFAYEYRPANVGRLHRLLEETYDRVYPDAHKFFMSEETRIGHEHHFNRPIPDGWIWPLPIEISSEQTITDRNPVRHRIVSIGRLTLFKTYSWYMVPILYRLRDKYPDTQWHIYGFGVCERELVDIIWKRAIDEGLIVFHGPLKYELIKGVFREAAAFIGMGTTLLEAAAAGVPSVPALVDDKLAATWGFVDQMPYYTVGETVPGMNPEAKVEDIFCQLFESSQQEEDAIIARGRQYVEAYGMDHLMNGFIDHMRALEGEPVLTPKLRIRYLWIRGLKLLRNIRLTLSRLGGPPVRHPGGDRLLH